jgi:hypothetical protein
MAHQESRGRPAALTSAVSRLIHVVTTKDEQLVAKMFVFSLNLLPKWIRLTVLAAERGW